MQPLPNLHKETLASLKATKNLLAFSGGVDSTALFFLLMEENIPFDIALVNYNTREQSKEEEAFAKELATTYHKTCFIHTCKLGNTNFEHHARTERYAFFEKLIHEHQYTTLLTAHHLNDRLEWFLMQLGRGAGLVEMLGMSEYEEKESYFLIRPLLHISKDSLLQFLENKRQKYFLDKSNESPLYLRNRIRKNHAFPLLKEYEEGICKSFAYLDEDAKRLLPKNTQRIKNLFIIQRENDDLMNIRQIDKAIKLLGKIASHETRQEILRTQDCVVSGRIAVCFGKESIFVAPFIEQTMDKKFKELCRIAGIPPKIRPYLYEAKIDLSALRLNHKP